MSFHTMRLLIELSLSLHFFIRLRVAFGGGWWQLPVLLWMALMLAPLLLQGAGLVPQSVMAGLLYVWPLWLGFLLFFTLSALALDAARLVTGAAGALGGRAWWGLLAGKRAVPLALGLALVLSAYSYYMAYNPRLVRVEFYSDKLPEGLDGLRVVQLTDIHLSRFVTHKDLRRITALAASAEPDILVVTGDLVDTDMTGRADEADLFPAINPRFGSFAVLGNHELYAGEKNSLDFYRKAGLRLLRGEAVECGGIVIAGVDDENFGERGNRRPAGQLLRSVKDSGKFVLFLKHRPALAPGTAERFDLQLSGHTHGGQIWPGHFLIKRVNGVLYGLNYTSSKSAVFTSRGAGFWGLPMRFLAPPEVVLIEIRRKNSPVG